MATGSSSLQALVQGNNPLYAPPSTLPLTAANASKPSLLPQTGATIAPSLYQGTNLQTAVQGSTAPTQETTTENPTWIKGPTGSWAALDNNGTLVQSGYAPDSHGLAHIVNGMWDGTYKDTTTTPTTVPSSLQSAVQPTITAPTANQMTYTPTNKVTDNSSKISDQYGQSLTAAQDALKASIQQSMGQYQDTITKAPATYQPLRNQASAAGASNMQNLQEQLANNGQQGGVNRTESTAVNSATENNINSLNQQQQSVIDTANKAINDLQAQGDIKGAELVAQNASDKLNALIAESNRVDSVTNANNQQNFTNGMAVNNYNSSELQNLFNDNIANANLANTTATTNANVANTNASTVYQNLVNAGYPAEQAIKMAQAQASLTGTNLNNDYQTLLNAGYPKTLAATLAQSAAQTAGQNLQNTAQGITNKYLPSQLQATINASNASANASNASASRSYSSGSSSSSTAAAKANTTANINAATQEMTNKVYAPNNTKDALKILTGNKADWLNGLQSAGMSGKDAVAFYTSLYNDLSK